MDRLTKGQVAEAFEIVRQYGEIQNWIAYANASLVKARDELAEAIRDARKMGVTWNDIGACLGISRQAAWDRWAAKVDGKWAG